MVLTEQLLSSFFLLIGYTNNPGSLLLSSLTVQYWRMYLDLNTNTYIIYVQLSNYERVIHTCQPIRIENSSLSLSSVQVYMCRNKSRSATSHITIIFFCSSISKVGMSLKKSCMPCWCQRALGLCHYMATYKYTLIKIRC